MIFSLLLFIAQWDFISSCTVIYINTLQQLTQTTQQMVYPVIGQNYVLNLDQYFEGNQLQYTTSSTYPIRQQVTINDIATTNFPGIYLKQQIIATSTMIATASNQNQVTAEIGETIAVLLFDTGNYYVYVGKVGLNNKTPITWNQLAQPISNYSSVNCTSILILSNQDVVVSCIQQSINQQLLYYFEQGSTQDVMPYLVQTGNIIGQIGQYVEMQAINLAYYQWQIYITYTNNTLQKSQIYVYNVTSKDPTVSLNPLVFVSATSYELPQSIVGSYIVDQYTAIIANTTNVMIYDMVTLTNQSMLIQQNILGISAFPLGNSQDSFQVLITILCQTGLQNIYIAQYQTLFNEIQTSDFMSFPTLFTADSSTSLTIGPEFVIIQDSLQQVVFVYPGWLNSNNTQNYTWQQKYTNQTGLIFNSFTQDIYLFGLNNQALIHLGAAYMLINIPLGSNPVNQTITVTANNQCSLNFSIVPVLGSQLNSQIYYATPQQQQKQVSEIPIQINQEKNFMLNNQFIGANLTYNGTVSPQSDSQTNLIQSIQVSLNVTPGEILFSQILPSETSNANPQLDYMYVLQLSSKPNSLYIYGCNVLTCSQPSTILVSSTVLGVANSNNYNSGQTQNFIAIFTANSIGSVQVYIIEGLSVKSNTIQNILVNQNVPTMTVSSIQIVSNILYIITDTPQTLQVVPLNNITDQQVFQGYDIVPRQIYSSPLYPNLIFLDNTYELQIYRVPNQFMYISAYFVQSLPYQLDMGATVGIAILQNGIYIAESNATNSALTLYPTQALDSFLNTPLTNLAITIPLSTYNIMIQNPVISSYSTSNFYLSIIASDQTNQLAVFQYTGAQLNVLYFSQYLPSAPSSLSLTSVIIDIKRINLGYDILCLQYAGKGAFYQITYNTYANFIPGEQNVKQQNYSIVYTATTPGQQSLTTQMDVSVVLSGLYITPMPTNYQSPNQSYAYFGQIWINPANYFTGYVENYKVGYKTISAFVMSNQNEIIQPITTSPAQLPIDNYMSATSSYGNAYIMDSTLQIWQYQNILNSKTYYPLWNMSNQYTQCPYMFMYNAYLLVVVCTNNDDSYLIYNSTVGQTTTNFTYLLGNPLPNLISAQYNYSQSVLALENNLTNATKSIYNMTVFQLTYNFLSLRLFGPSLIQKSFKQQLIHYSIFATLNQTKNVYSYGVSVITNSRIVKLYAIEQNQTTYQLTVAKSYEIAFPPFPSSKLNFTAIQMYSVGTYNSDQQTTNMIFVLQTPTRGYVYEFQTSPTLIGLKQVSNVKVIPRYQLMPLDQANAIKMFVQNSSIVTIYQTTDNTIVGVFTLPDKWLTDFANLYLISYQQYTNLPQNFQISSNGTLFFQNDGTTNQLQIQPNLIVNFNVNTLKQEKNLVEEANSSGISIVLKAINQQQNSIVFINGSLVAPIISGDNSVTLHEGLHIGLGVFFFCVVAGALIYLCINSQKRADDYSYNGRQEVEM